MYLYFLEQVNKQFCYMRPHSVSCCCQEVMVVWKKWQFQILFDILHFADWHSSDKCLQKELRFLWGDHFSSFLIQIWANRFLQMNTLCYTSIAMFNYSLKYTLTHVYSCLQMVTFNLYKALSNHMQTINFFLNKLSQSHKLIDS